MFKFLKDKLKKAVSIFSKKVKEEAEIRKEEKVAEVKEEVRETLEEPVEAEEEIKEEAREGQTEEEIEDEIKEVKEEFEKEIEEVEKEKTPKEIEEEIKEVKEEFEEEIAEVEEEKKEKTEEEIEEEIKGIKEEYEQEIEEIKEEEAEEPEEAPQLEEAELPEKKSFFKRLFGKKEKLKEEEKKEEPKKEEKEIELAAGAEKAEEPEEAKERAGFFKKIKETFTTVKLSEDKFEKLFWELEVVLLENNVAVEVIDKIKADLKKDLTTGKVSRKGVEELIEDSLRDSVKSLFMDQRFNIIEEIKKKKDKPYIIAFIGVNGSGKTTTMAKVAHLLMKNNLSVVFAASDTFRAAAIQQLQEHADRLGIKMIRHDYESDPAAVAFDAVKHAKAKGIDVVLIDTAGRLHSNDNLMNELKKLVRVNNPDLKIFVGESITGNDCVEQAKLFNQVVGIDVIILAKADVDEKGGAAVSVSYVTKKPIIYLGTGQKYEDLTEFKPEIIMNNIGL
ncbi:MAG TPA: signal recognition particle-docking protein FtsY [Candidatus Nanoarchaeia archaeon]|nr:signal recognition particle-docking protein FtsY [Candidatus Nanoarchaeia archaeon]